MSDVNAPDTGGGEAVSVVTPADDTGANISVSQAARALQSARFKKPEPESAAPATDPEPVSAEADDAQPQADPVETTEEAEPAAEPPIERPRSWTKDEDAEWQSLPRAMQQKIVAREQERDAGLRRSQNEAAEKLKGLSAKEQAVEQAKQQYEAALPALLKTLQQQQAGQFSDIQSMADVEKLASEDPFRFSLWQAQQMKIAAVKQEVDLTQARQTQDQQQQWSKFAEEQDKLAIERIPDLADKAKASKLQDTVAKYLEGIGFTNDELGKNWNGERVFRDARMQQILLDAARYADLKAKPPVPTRPVPQVQRPGVSQPRGASDEQAVQHLNTKFERTGNLKDAAALLTAKRAAARR
jgi:uncharacterized protein (DUF1697 family)